MRQDAVWCCMQEGARRGGNESEALFSTCTCFYVYCLNLLRIREHTLEILVCMAYTHALQPDPTPHHHNMYMFPASPKPFRRHRRRPRRRATMRRGGEGARPTTSNRRATKRSPIAAQRPAGARPHHVVLERCASSEHKLVMVWLRWQPRPALVQKPFERE